MVLVSKKTKQKTPGVLLVMGRLPTYVGVVGVRGGEGGKTKIATQT